MKEDLINYIKNILKNNGSFYISKLEGEDQSIAVGSLGNYVGLAEGFTQNYVEVNVYESSSMSSGSIDTYEEQYENLSVDILGDVLLVCQQWEAECIRTEKRISN